MVASKSGVVCELCTVVFVQSPAGFELKQGVDSHLTAGNKGLCFDQAVFFYMRCADNGVIVVQMQIIIEQLSNVQKARVML